MDALPEDAERFRKAGLPVVPTSEITGNIVCRNRCDDTVFYAVDDAVLRVPDGRGGVEEIQAGSMTLTVVDDTERGGHERRAEKAERRDAKARKKKHLAEEKEQLMSHGGMGGSGVPWSDYGIPDPDAGEEGEAETKHGAL